MVQENPSWGLEAEAFHGWAFAAFIDQAIEERGPTLRPTRQRAFSFFEEDLATKNRRGR